MSAELPLKPGALRPIADEAVKLADALIGKLGNPAADRLLEEFTAHVAGHSELVDEGGCSLCRLQAVTMGTASQVAVHLTDAGRSLLAAFTALTAPLIGAVIPGADTPGMASPEMET